MYSSPRARRGGLGFTSWNANYTPAQLQGATAQILATATCDPSQWGGGQTGDDACSDAAVGVGVPGTKGGAIGTPALWSFSPALVAIAKSGGPAAVQAQMAKPPAPTIAKSDCLAVQAGTIGTSSLDQSYVAACAAQGVDISAAIQKSQAAAAAAAAVPIPATITANLVSRAQAAGMPVPQALIDIANSVTAAATQSSGQTNFSFAAPAWLSAPVAGFPMWELAIAGLAAAWALGWL